MNIVIPSLLNEDLHPIPQKWFNGMGPDKAWTVAYAGFWKGGGGQELQKIWEERSESEISPISCPKLGEEQKKKVFSQIWSNFLPKLGCRPKTNVQNIPFV